MHARRSDVDALEHPAAEARHAGIEQSRHFRLGQRFEFDHDLGKTIRQAAAEPGQEGALPDVLVEREYDIEPLDGLAQ